jgi:hypothetical protein
MMLNESRPNRRTVLRAAGVAVSLPLLESLGEAFPTESQYARRMVAINVGLGLHLPNIQPNETGKNYTPPPYLQVLEPQLDQLTFISGTSHPGVGGGHQSGKSFLTAAKHPSSAGFANSISIDQLAAERLGRETRFRSLSLSTSGPGLSWSRSGVEIPTDTQPSRLYQRLFLEGKPDEKARQIQAIQDGRSVLDLVLDQYSGLQRHISRRDQAKMDQYFEAVREAEKRLVKAEAWALEPKPTVEVPPPQDERDSTRMLERLKLMYDMMFLALKTESTRFITLFHTGMNAVPQIPGVDTDYHMLSHHGKDEAKIAQLTIVESELMKLLGGFLGQLAESQTDQGSMLDDTMVLFGSNLGNASSHDTRNLHILLAGGGFQHGQHLAFDKDRNEELPKLYVSMLQRLGLEVDQFGDTTGTLTGLEPIT